MSNYTKYGRNVIFCGPAQMLDQPNRKESPVAAEVLPGTVVHLNADGFFEAGAGALSYVLDRDHLGHAFVSQPFAAEDIANAFWPQSGLVLNVRTAGGLDVVEDQAMYIGDDGVLTGTATEGGGAAYCHAAETLTTGDAPELVAMKFA